MTHSSTWPDGTPRSQNNGFTLGFGEPINWRPLNTSALLRQSSTSRMDEQRATGTDPSRIYGLSQKSDNALLSNRHGAPKSTTPLNKTQRLRDSLKGGPLTCAQMAEATGIAVHFVSSLLQGSVGNGRVKVLRAKKPFRYVLNKPEFACYFDEATA